MVRYLCYFTAWWYVVFGLKIWYQNHINAVYVHWFWLQMKCQGCVRFVHIAVNGSYNERDVQFLIVCMRNIKIIRIYSTFIAIVEREKQGARGRAEWNGNKFYEIISCRWKCSAVKSIRCYFVNWLKRH